MCAPGADEMYFTVGPSLRDHPAELIVRVTLDGPLREGNLPPIQGAVVAMHTAIRPGVPAILLANHGVLVFHRTPELAIMTGQRHSSVR